MLCKYLNVNFKSKQFKVVAVKMITFQVGTFDPYSDDPRLGIQKITMCPISETLVVGGTAGQVVILQFDREERELEVKRSHCEHCE